MSKRLYQSNFFDDSSPELQLDDAEIDYFAHFIEHNQALDLYQTLLNEVEWRQEVIKVYGKLHPTPRLSCWMGEAHLNYGYSHTRMEAVPWSPTLLGIKEEIQTHTEASFNSVLINYYRDGQDSNGWHSDDEPELGKNPVIASVSLGAPRDFHLRHKNRSSMTKKSSHKMTLENGSLLMMKGTTQHYWQHHIPKRAHAQGRINLTFRTIKALDPR